MRPQHPAAGTATAPSLTAWGISADADLIYRCLLAFGAQSTMDLQRSLGIPRHRVTDGLDELAAAGAVRRRAGKPSRVWTSVPVSDVVASLRRRRTRTGPVAHLQEPRAVVERALPGSVPLGDRVRHLPTRALTRTRLAELVRVARHEHLAMSPERSYDAESARAAVPLDRRLLQRGVRMRVLGAQPTGVDPLVGYGRAPDELRPEYRESPDVPMKLIVVDRRVALFPVTPADLERGYVEVTDEAVVAELAARFDREWAAAEQPEESRMRQISLTEREQALVNLLVRGHTDSTAARELRVSRRTVSTTVSRLMEKLGVTNRFQLGVALGALHLLPAPGRLPSSFLGETR
jgi:DNA-binding CsgD family transcriptional regulator